MTYVGVITHDKLPIALHGTIILRVKLLENFKSQQTDGAWFGESLHLYIFGWKVLAATLV